MRPGGGKNKGSAFEREVGRALSLWLTAGARHDIFSRNVLSGGTFTIAANKGKTSSHMPGDLMAAHPLAFAFLSRFLVECKHLRSLELEAYMFDARGTSMLAQIVALAAAQAQLAGLNYLIVAKQNRRDPFVIMAGSVGEEAIASIPNRGRIVITPNHHLLHKRRVCIMRLGDLLRMVSPERLLARMSGNA